MVCFQFMFHEISFVVPMLENMFEKLLCQYIDIKAFQTCNLFIHSSWPWMKELLKLHLNFPLQFYSLNYFCRQIIFILTQRYASILGQCFHSQVCLGELKGNAEVVFQMFFLIFTASIKFSAISKNMTHFFIWSLIILLNI